MTTYSHLDLMGGFSKDTISKFFERIERTSPGPIVVSMMGSGGAVAYKQAIIDVLVSFDVPVTILSRGMCASACALFPHSGDFIRLCYPNTSFLYHARNNSIEGNVDELENKVERFRKQVERDKKILMGQIGLTEKEIEKYQGNDYTVSADEALYVGKHGMVDGIIVKDYRDGRFLIRTRDGNKEINVTLHRRGDLAKLPAVK